VIAQFSASAGLMARTARRAPKLWWGSCIKGAVDTSTARHPCRPLLIRRARNPIPFARGALARRAWSYWRARSRAKVRSELFRPSVRTSVRLLHCRGHVHFKPARRGGKGTAVRRRDRRTVGLPARASWVPPGGLHDAGGTPPLPPARPRPQQPSVRPVALGGGVRAGPQP